MNQIEQQTIYSPYQIKEKSKNLFLFWMIASVLALRCMGSNDAVSDLLLLAIPVSVMGAIMFFSGSAEKERMLISFFCKRESQIRESLCLEQTLLDIKARQPKPLAQSVSAKLPDQSCSAKAKKKKQGTPKPAKQSRQVTTKTERAEQKAEEDRFIDYEDYFKTSPPEP